MNTPAHLLLAAAILTRPSARKRNSGAVLGGALPDLSLYLLAGTALFLLSIPPQVVFNDLYFSPAWQTIFAIDNSIPLWTAVLALGLWRKWEVVSVVAIAALLHIALDFPLHHDDGRPHFWPFSNWVFESPVSYWDSAQYAGFVAPFTLLMSAVCSVALWRRFPSWGPRLSVAALMAAEVWVARQWLLFF